MESDRIRRLNPTRSVVTLLLVAGSLASSSMALAATTVQAEPAIPRGVSLASWFDNGHGGRYVLQLAKGRPLAPGMQVAGIVLSDSDCAPDARGLNHCHNVIELADGSRVEVINNHQMMRNRCLGNGDRLTLRPVNAKWVAGDLAAR